jgi:hypothetical protein
MRNFAAGLGTVPATYESVAQGIIDDVLGRVEARWGVVATRVVEEWAANVVIKAHPAASVDPGGSPTALALTELKDPDADWAKEFRRILAEFRSGTIQSEFDLSDALRRMQEANDKVGTNIFAERLNPAWFLVDPLAPSEATLWANARARLTRALEFVISHELGHAQGFLGHIRYVASVPEGERKDIMQTGVELPETFSFFESRHFFRILLGLGWSSDDALRAVELMTNGSDRWHHYEDGSSEWQSVTIAWTNPVDPADVNANGRVTQSDLLAIVNRLLAAGGVVRLPSYDLLTPGPFPDVNADGKISQSDLAGVVNRLLSQSVTTIDLKPTVLEAPVEVRHDHAVRDAIFALGAWQEQGLDHEPGCGGSHQRPIEGPFVPPPEAPLLNFADSASYDSLALPTSQLPEVRRRKLKPAAAAPEAGWSAIDAFFAELAAPEVDDKGD